ncbi:acylphosphatase [Pseudomonas kuykendallii]|uniref:Acylphosphatase n=1 Tax=Pseudomonas kuykendallii TaxID=1007099 RepID=A0A2W5F3M1_9PSED|nr:acylphosphatase [Pseudomonas kuykendallii]PZP25782.1 MAG: acylphosphatase [Pseudomonas kuykendallii]
MARRCLHALIAGKVQGVGFRQATQAQAQRLGLAGWVANLPDGRVETLFEGRDEALQQLANWLKHGPAGARVDALALDERPAQGLVGFAIRR